MSMIVWMVFMRIEMMTRLMSWVSRTRGWMGWVSSMSTRMISKSTRMMRWMVSSMVFWMRSWMGLVSSISNRWPLCNQYWWPS
jgi:hypothetical protein